MRRETVQSNDGQGIKNTREREQKSINLHN